MRIYDVTCRQIGIAKARPGIYFLSTLPKSDSSALMKSIYDDEFTIN
ncbi:MAG: hypothetical protein ABIK93_02075 [candidate division WOR-3 bacterium]